MHVLCTGNNCVAKDMHFPLTMVETGNKGILLLLYYNYYPIFRTFS